MKRLILIMLCVLYLTACSGAETVSSEFVVVPRETQDEALAANEALLDAYDWDGDFDTVDVMPKDYAGRYIDEDNVLTILTVAPLRDVLETYQEACGTKNIRLEQAEFSYYDLGQAMDALTEYNGTHDPALCYSWGINDSTNQIEIVVSADMEEEAKKHQEQHPCISYTVEKVELEIADHSEYLTDDRITLQLAKKSFSVDETAIAYSIQNASDQELYFSRTTKLDVRIGDEWYAIPYRSDVAFTMDLPCVMANGEAEAGEWLEGRNYTFTPGTYRIGLTYCLGEYAPLEGKDFDHIAYVTFELTE